MPNGAEPGRAQNKYELDGVGVISAGCSVCLSRPVQVPLAGLQLMMHPTSMHV